MPEKTYQMESPIILIEFLVALLFHQNQVRKFCFNSTLWNYAYLLEQEEI